MIFLWILCLEFLNLRFTISEYVFLIHLNGYPLSTSIGFLFLNNKCTNEFITKIYIPLFIDLYNYFAFTNFVFQFFFLAKYVSWIIISISAELKSYSKTNAYAFCSYTICYILHLFYVSLRRKLPWLSKICQFAFKFV